jgi:hypothetical protein
LAVSKYRKSSTRCSETSPIPIPAEAVGRRAWW